MNDLLAGLAAGNYHHGGIRVLNMGAVDRSLFERLLTDTATVVDELPPSDVTKAGHQTAWTEPAGIVRQWSLLNRSGRTDDTSADFSYSRLDEKQTIGGDSFAELRSTIPDMVNLRLNLLGPGASLSPHEEHLPRRIGRDRVGMRARFHLPLVTNPGAAVLADGDVFHLHASRLWLFNNGCVHSANNTGDTGRYHLVFDVLLTRRTFDALFTTPPAWLSGEPRPADPLGSITVSEWEHSNGMSEADFERRTLGWMPTS